MAIEPDRAAIARRVVIAVVVVLVIAVVAGAAAYWRLEGQALTRMNDVRVLVAFTALQEDGSRAVDEALYCRLKPGGGRIEAVLVPTSLEVGVPGITEDRLSEIYSFGGPSLLAQAFSRATGVRVDAAIVIDESALEKLLARVPPVSIVTNRAIDVFRQGRYSTFGADTTVTLTPAQTVDLLAAAGFLGGGSQGSVSETTPTAPDVAGVVRDGVLQGRLVAGILRSLSSRGTALPSVSYVEVWATDGLAAHLEGLAHDAGWPRLQIQKGEGSFRLMNGRMYWMPSAAWWGSTFGRG